MDVVSIFPGIIVYGGDIVSADDVVANIPIIYAKDSATPRSSTTTYAADPELQNIPLEVGAYSIELILFFILATSSTQKLKTQWKFSGSWNSPIRACIGPGNVTTGTVPGAVTESTFSGYVADTQDATYNLLAGSQYGVVRESCNTVQVTSAGVLSLHWAQGVSSANATQVNQGTNFSVRKISN